MSAPRGNKNAQGNKGGGRKPGSTSGIGFLRNANTQQMQRALTYMLDYILDGKLPDEDGLGRWKELLMLKMKLAMGEVQTVKKVNGVEVKLYSKPPDRESIDWLIHWIVGKQPDIVQFQNPDGTPLDKLSDDELEARVRQRIKELGTRAGKAKSGKGGAGVGDVPDGVDSVSKEPAQHVQATGENSSGNGSVSKSAETAPSKQQQKDNRNPVTTPRTLEVNAGNDQLDSSADISKS